jgi:hypothetical protein
METMTFEQALERGKSLDGRAVWNALMETRANIDRLSAEADVRWAETVEIIRQSTAKTDEFIQQMAQRIDKMGQNVGGLNRSVGDLIEILMAGNLWEKFPEYNLCRAFRRLPIYDNSNRQVGEVDILLVNTDCAMVVEVKAEPSEDDIEHHLSRMKLLQKYPIDQIKGKRLYGAIAGGFVPEYVSAKAYKAGLFVLELNGNQVSLVKKPADFKPQEW